MWLKKAANDRAFCENRRNGSCTLLQGLNGFLDVLSAFSHSTSVKFA
jgi:hypothetical protein